MSKDLKDDNAKITARRRLVRGVFAAPTALTLYSGNVFATSSNLRALANQFVRPQHPSTVTNLTETNPTDTWIRVRVYSSNGVQVVSGAEVAREPGCGSSFVSGEWATVATPSMKHVIGDEPTPTNEFAALLFNEKGRIVGVSTGEPVFGTTALTRSAGASIVVAVDCV